MKRGIVVKDDLYQAAVNTMEASGLTRAFAQMFGEEATLEYEDRRFEVRRLGGTNYLMDRRLTDRRRH